MNNEEKSNTQKYTVTKINGAYTVMRLLPNDEFYIHYTQRRDELEFIDNRYWLRLFACESPDKATAYLKALGGISITLPLSEGDSCTE